MPPVAENLTSTGGWVDRCPHRLIKHFCRRDAEFETECAIAVIQVEPIVSRLQDHARRCKNALVASAGDLEEDLVLVLELDFLVVQPTRQQHIAIGGNELLGREPSAW